MGNATKKKIRKALIVNPYWDSMGGGERYTASLVKLLLENKWQVDIVWPSMLSTMVNKMFGIDISAAKYVDQGVFTSRYHLAFYVSDGSLPLSFAKKTLIHFQFPFTNVSGKNLSNSIKSKLYTSVCNSQFTKSVIDSEFGIDSEVVYPPISTSQFRPEKKQKIILYVGRFSQLTQKKNHHLLIEAFKKISHKLPNWRLVIAGGMGVGSDIQYVDQMEKMSEKFPITILKNPDFNQIRKLYADSSVFWSASGLGVDEKTNPKQVEHFGISLVEAMAAGCVPIVSKAGGHVEIVEDKKSGFLFSNLEELKSLTMDIIKSPSVCNKIADAAMTRSKAFDTIEFNKSYLALI